MDFEEYLNEVVTEARKLGYDKQAVMCFKYDIQESYEDGKKIQECVDEHF